MALPTIKCLGRIVLHIEYCPTHKTAVVARPLVRLYELDHFGGLTPVHGKHSPSKDDGIDLSRSNAPRLHGHAIG